MVALTACGPSRAETSSESLLAQTQQIALDYQSSGDLESARADLSTLDVANANQWLVLVAEETIATGGASETADALVALTQDLGLSSTITDRYAREHGIGPAGASAQQQPTPEPLVEQATVDVTVAPPPAVSEPVAVSTEEPSTEEPSTGESLETTATVDSVTVEAEISTAEQSTPDTPAETAAETTTVDTTAQVQALSPMNVRAGPSTEHPIIAALQAGSSARITAKDNSGDWWQIAIDTGTTGWIYAPLVETVGNVSGVAIAQAIPTPPPATPTPIPQPTAVPAPAEEPPVEEPPAAEPTAEQTTPEEPAAPPASGGLDFQLVEQRLWDVEENGGHLAGESVNCGDKQVLQVIVEDANGNRLDGVTIQGVYRNELQVTGDKGPGVTELVMNTNGDDIVVLRDVDGREVSSDRAAGNTARTWDIPFAQLIQGRFCKDDASCQKFVDTTGCFGHFSWTVRFRRNY